VADGLVYDADPVSGLPGISGPLRAGHHLQPEFFHKQSNLGACALTIVVQLAAVYVPAAREFLHTLPLGAAELAICVAMSAVVSGVVEIEKWWRR